MRPAAAPLVLVAGLVIIVLALIDVVRDLQGRPDPAAHGADGDGLGHDGTGHHETGRVAWLLLLPVLTVLLVSPSALGSDAVDLAGGRTAPTAAVPADDPLPPGDAPVLAVVDFVSRVAAMSSSGRAGQAGPLVGRDVTLTGFVVPARTGPGTDLTRLVISCCAADASPVRVHLADPAGALVPRMAAPSQETAGSACGAGSSPAQGRPRTGSCPRSASSTPRTSHPRCPPTSTEPRRRLNLSSCEVLTF